MGTHVKGRRGRTAASEQIEIRSGTGWAERPEALAPALAGEVTCDVAVVGGGVGGAAAALRLAERGADVVLAEADVCGWGATARSAGYLGNSLAADPQLLSLLHRRRLPQLVRLADNAFHFARRLIDQHGIRCDFEQTGLVLAATTPAQLRKGRRNAKILIDAGADAEFVEGNDLGLPDTFLGGMVEEVGGLLDPGKYALGLREALLASTVRTFERSPVQSVTTDSTGVRLTLPGGRIRADRALLLANARLGDLDHSPPRVATPIWTSLVEAGPVEPERLDAVGWTSRSGIVTQHTLLENYRPTSRGTIVFGTRQLRTAAHGTARQPLDRRLVADLVRGFRDRFPTLADVPLQQAWGGWIGMTSSWLPVAGDVDPRVSYAVGCNGHGLAQAPYLGHLLADHVAGDAMHDDLRAVWSDRSRFRRSLILNRPALRAAWTLDRLADRFARR